MNPSQMNKRVVIVGAGLAGLVCARLLIEAGATVEILERDETVGGRVQTDEVDGFLLDRGFQILLTGYPELRRHLDLDALDLRPFEPGASLWTGTGFETIGDPLRKLDALVPTLRASSGSLFDKLRILKLRALTLRGGSYDAFEAPDQTTMSLLREQGFSEGFLHRFFRPFLGGIFLEPELATTARFFRFVFRMFAKGDAAVPARGMGEISRQLAAPIPAEAVKTAHAVRAVDATGVHLDDGHRIEADRVVVACEGPSAHRLVPEVEAPASCGVTCFYFAADRAPTSRPILHLDGVGEGPVNNMHVATAVSADLAPAGQTLVSATCLGVHDDLEGREKAARAQLERWFGPEVARWRSLRTYAIPHALPAQPVGSLRPSQRPIRTESGLFVCGDHRDQASIDGAMVSGRRAAEAVLASWG
ncbi:MAG: NAD(P)/FAD-dependent oxidoreductase [Myxococcota bacterium]